jgi:hypothetical protein
LAAGFKSVSCGVALLQRSMWYGGAVHGTKARCASISGKLPRIGDIIVMAMW